MTDWSRLLKSNITGSVWPVLPSSKSAAIVAMLTQLEETQWQPEDVIRQQQFQQLHPLLKHALDTVTFYQEYFQGISLPEELNNSFFKTLPIVTRAMLQEAGDQLYSTNIPPSHGKVSEVKTSGSTGVQLTALTTDIVSFYWDVFTMRDHLWHRRDLTGKLGIIRYLDGDKGVLPDVIELGGWGCVAGEMMNTGPTCMVNINNSIHAIVDWLNDFQPETLLLYPSLLDELLQDKTLLKKLKLSSLKEIRTLSEAITPETRLKVESHFKVKLVDLYSTIELGYIALQCPDNEHYHIQSENVLVEVLDEQGNECHPGETGRIVVTALHNYASPLIRYELGDMVEVGESCSCGRGLPVIKRIYGRYRNMITYPDGRRQYPVLGFAQYKTDSIRQFQLIQISLYDLRYKLKVSQPLSVDEQQDIVNVLHKTLNYPFKVTFEYVETIRHSVNGKYEEFISLL